MFSKYSTDLGKMTAKARSQKEWPVVLLKGESIPYPRGSAEWITGKCDLPDPTTASGTLSRGKQMTFLQF